MAEKEKNVLTVAFEKAVDKIHQFNEWMDEHPLIEIGFGVALLSIFVRRDQLTESFEGSKHRKEIKDELFNHCHSHLCMVLRY